MLQYLLSLVLNSVRGMKAQGHQLVTRARKGDTGPMGISYRVSFWQAGKEYRNDINNTTASERYIDICVNMPISLIGDSNFRAYQCVTTHTSDNNNNTLGKAGLWTSINSLKPMATPLLLAGKIVADYIDVDTLAVKHLNGADGSFAGILQFPFVNLIDNSTFDHSTGGGQDMYYVMHDTVASLEILASQRYYGSPYSSTSRYNHFELPTMPDGTVLNIIGYGNIKNVIRPVYFTGDIIYNTSDTTGYSLEHTTQLTCKDQFFLRMMSYNGMWFVITILGAYEVAP